MNVKETSITLDCGCEIEFYPPHDTRCNCEEAMGTCQKGYWFMSEPCDQHQKPEVPKVKEEGGTA